MALQEFDFLQNHEDGENSGEAHPDEEHLLIQPPPLQFQDPVSPLPPSQRYHHKEDAPDLLRPILTMPPVLLMGGGIVPPSPIVELPPTPDANQMPVVEYPEEDDEPAQEFIVQDQIDIEVRYLINSKKTQNFIFFLTLCCFCIDYYYYYLLPYLHSWMLFNIFFSIFNLNLKLLIWSCG